MPSRAPGSRSSPIRLLQLTTFVSTLDRFAMPPLLVAIANDLTTPLSSIVQAASAYFLAYGVMQPVWGVVSDFLGLVRTMRLALLLAALATITSALASTPLALGLARGLAGAFFGAAYPASLIYVGDTVPAGRRQREVTRLMVGVAAGTALASVGGGILAQLLTWRLAFVVTGTAALGLCVLLRRLSQPPLVRSDRSVLAPILQVARCHAAVFVLLLSFIEGAVLLGVLTVLPAALEAAGATPALAGGVTGVYGIAVYAFAMLVGRLSRRSHPALLIALGGLSALTACTLLVFSQSPTTGSAVAVLLGLAWTGMHSSLQTWATEVLPAARATVVSLFAGALFAGSATAAAVVADLAEAGRYPAIFLLAAAASVPLGLFATWGRARWHAPRSH